MPYCHIERDKDGKLTARYSMEIQLLRLFAERYNFRYNLIDANQQWGMIVNGTWTGAIGQVVYGVWLYEIQIREQIKSKISFYC